MDRLLSAVQLLFLKVIAWRPTQTRLWQFSTLTGAVGIVLTLLLFWQQSTGAHVVPDQSPMVELGNATLDPAEDSLPSSPDSHPRRHAAQISLREDDETTDTHHPLEGAEDPFGSPNRAELAATPELTDTQHLSDSEPEPTYAPTEPHLLAADNPETEEEFFQPEEKKEEMPAEQHTLLAPTHDD